MQVSWLDMQWCSYPYIEWYYHELYSSDDHWVLPLQLPTSYGFNMDMFLSIL